MLMKYVLRIYATNAYVLQLFCIYYHTLYVKLICIYVPFVLAGVALKFPRLGRVTSPMRNCQETQTDSDALVKPSLCEVY